MPQDRTETSYWYSEAKTAAAEYTLLGNKAKADEMNGIADSIKNAILTNLWASGPVTDSPASTGTTCDDTGARVTGEIGNAVSLCGTNEYVSLPAGIVSGLHDFTISAWVNPRADTAWSRVFDFGTGTGVYMFLTVSAGGGPVRFAITTGGSGGEQQLNAPSGQLPLNTWTHLAVTLSGTTGTLYVNGTAGRDQRQHDAEPLQPRQHDQQLDRQVAVRRPQPERDRRRLQHLQPGAVGRGDRQPGRRAGQAPATSRTTSSTRPPARPRSTPRAAATTPRSSRPR